MSCRSTSTHSPSRAPSVPSGRKPASLAPRATRWAIERTWRSELPQAMIIVSAMSVRPRTSSTLTLTAFMSSSALVTACCSLESPLAAGRARLRVAMRFVGCSCKVESAALRTVLGSIASRFKDDLAHLLRDQVARVAACDQECPQFGGGDFQLRAGMHVNTTGKLLVQLADAAGAVVHHHFPERPAGSRAPARAVCHDDVRKAEKVAPAVPLWQAEERVHAEQQAQRALRELRAQLRERVDRVGGTRTAYLAVIHDEARLLGHRGAHHLQAHRGTGVQLVAMRGMSGRQQEHLRQTQFLPYS